MPSSPPLPPPRLVITWTQPDPAILDILTASLTPGGPYNLTFTPVPNYYASPIVPKAQLTPYTSGTINRADLTGLPPASTLYYVVSSDGGAVTTPERAVKTHPGVGPDVPITMTLLADWDFECFDGKVCEPAAVLNHVIRADVWEGVNAGAIIAGDLAYANGNQSHWDGWQRFVEPFSSTTPFMANAGNHGTSAGATPFPRTTIARPLCVGEGM